MDFSDLGDTTSTSAKKGKFDFSDLGDISKNSQDSTQGEQKPSQLQQIAEQINIPSRIGRSAGVGIGLASEATGLSPANILPSNSMGIEQVAALLKAFHSPQQALSSIGNAVSRAGQAFKPGFKPTEQERPYSQIGEVAGNVATGAALGGATAGLGTLPGLASEAAISGGLSALTQAQSKGEISPTETAVNAAIPLGIRGVLRATNAIANAFPKITSFFTKVKPEAFEAIKNDPKFLSKYEGSVNAVEKKTDKFLEALDITEEGFTNDFNKVGKQYGVEYIRGQQRPIAEIEKDFSLLQKSSGRSNMKIVDTGLVDEAGKSISKEVPIKPIQKSEKLQKLLNLDRDINESTKGSYDAREFRLKQSIQKEINKLPGGPKIQYLRSKFSDFLDIKKNLSKALTNPEQAPAVIVKIIEGDIKGALTGSYNQKLEGIKALEKYAGKNILEPLRNELLAKSLRRLLPNETGLERGASIFNPKVGAIMATVGSPRLGAEVNRGIGIAQRFLQPAIQSRRGVGLALGLGLGQRRRQE